MKIKGILKEELLKYKGEHNDSINEDKSMNLKAIMGLDDELIDAMMSMNESSGEDIFGTTETEDKTTGLQRRIHRYAVQVF